MTPGIEAAKARANDTEYVRKYGCDATYWTHFLSFEECTGADYLAAYETVLAVNPEATSFLDHLRSMRKIALLRDETWS
jgi:hypothetical protein